MVGHIQTKHFTLEIQLGFLIPLLHIGHIHHGIAHARIVFAGILQIGEQIKLAFGLLAFQTDHRINRSLMNRKQGTTVRINRIKRTGLNQRFDQSSIQRLHRHTLDEIREIHIPAMTAVAFLDNRVNRSLADITNGAKAKTHHIADSGILVHRLVHIRRQHLNAHAASLTQIQRGLVFVRTRTLQQSRHELHRIMGLQIRGPIRNQTVCGRMRLIERVARERHQNIPHGLGRLLGIPMLLHAREERHLLLGQYLRLLLTHRSTKHICLAQRITSQNTRSRLYLLLVHNQTIRLIKHLLQRLSHLRMNRRDLLQTILTLRIIRMRIHIHRTRTIQRDQCGNIVEVIRLQRFQQRTHTIRIQLEHAKRVTSRQQIVRGTVIQRNLRMVDTRLAIRLDIVQRIANNRQVGKTKKIHLDQTKRFTRMIFQRGRNRTIGTFQQRRRIRNRLATHDRGARMHAGLTNQPLNTHRLIRNTLRIRIGIIQFTEFTSLRITFRRRLENIAQRNILATRLRRRQRLGDTLAHGEFVAHDSRGILQRLLGFDGAVDHTLRDLVSTVLVADVIKHSAAAIRIEIDVDIR